MTTGLAAAIIAVVTSFVAPTALAQSITSQQADAILQELRGIRALLERGVPAQAAAPQAAPDAPVSLRISGSYVLGRPDAPVTMVEFTDYECPFCRQFHMASFEEIKRKYVDTGKVRYVSRDFPLSMHANAMQAAKIARCAGEQGHFWEMRRALIVNGNALTSETMANLGKGLRLDEREMDKCVADSRLDKALSDDIAQASNLGVSGTPTFFIGRSDGDSVNGMRIVGALPLATFDSRIQALLAAPQ